MNLSSVFFAPTYSELLPLFIETAKSFKFSYDANSYNLVMRIISKYHEDYNKKERLARPDNWGRLQGDFNLELMLKEADIFCKNRRLLDMFKSPNSFLSLSKQQKWSDSIINIENNIFAVCTSKEVLSSHNLDAFETAGGSQSFESLNNTDVFLSLNPYHGIYLLVPMWLTHEYYNNNFAGVKLSGGESTFKKSGEPILKDIKTNSHDFLKVIEQYNLDLKSISLSNGIEILKEYIF